jgi:hypothetical protein
VGGGGPRSIHAHIQIAGFPRAFAGSALPREASSAKIEIP